MSDEMQNSKLKKSSGFTLIELMLVIIVIAGVTLYAATTLRTENREGNELTTSADMQSWLNAMSSYRINNDKWPTDLQTLIDDKYIPEEALCSPWPGVGVQGAACSNRIEYKIKCPGNTCLPNNKYIGIEVETPNEEIAAKIGALLPSSYVDQSSIAAFTAMPAIISDATAFSTLKWGYIVHAGTVKGFEPVCSPSKFRSIWLPKCEQGFEGHYMLFYMEQRTGRAEYTPGPWGCPTSSWDKHNYMNLSFSNISNPTDNPTVTASNFRGSLKANLTNLYFITFCIPNGSWYPGGAANNGAKQCKNTGGFWGSYNADPNASCNSATSSVQLK